LPTISAGQVKLLTALLDFRDAAIKLTQVWDENRTDGEELSKDYPFNNSFDEVVIDIIKWVETIKQS
jgi:hypothetical protein